MIIPFGKITDNSTLIVSNVFFIDLFSEENGGAILISEFERNFKVILSSFCNCSSLANGGAIYSPCKSVFLSDTIFTRCKSINGASIYTIFISNSINLDINKSVVNFCVTNGSSSHLISLSGNININYINCTNCISRHISGILFSFPTLTQQLLAYSQLANNTSIDFGSPIQYNTNGKCKIMKTNIIGVEDNVINSYAIRITDNVKLTIESSCFMKNFIAAFIKNSDVNPVIDIINSFRTDNFPIGLSSVPLSFNSQAATADVRFDLKYECPTKNRFRVSHQRTKVRVVVMAFLSAFVKSDNYY